MSTIRPAARKRYTAISRETLNDTDLSFRARGVLVWLLDKPDDWKTTADLIAAQGSEGRDAIRAALRELELFGYLHRRKWRGDNGVWTSEWLVYERPEVVEGVVEGDPASGDDEVDHDGKPAVDNQRRKTRPQELRTTEQITELDGAARKPPDPSCFQCHGEGLCYLPGIGADGPCPCTFEPARSARDEVETK